MASTAPLASATAALRRALRRRRAALRTPAGLASAALALAGLLVLFGGATSAEDEIPMTAVSLAPASIAAGVIAGPEAPLTGAAAGTQTPPAAVTPPSRLPSAGGPDLLPETRTHAVVGGALLALAAGLAAISFALRGQEDTRPPEPPPPPRRVRLVVSPVQRLGDLVEVLNVLHRTPGVVEARALTMQGGWGEFDAVVSGRLSQRDLARRLRELLGGPVRVEEQPA